MLVVARPDGRLQPRPISPSPAVWPQEFAPKPEGEKGLIAAVRSARRPGRGRQAHQPRGPHGQATLVMLELRTEFMAVENMDLLDPHRAAARESAAAEDFPKGLELGITGSAAVGADMLFSAEESIRNTEWATVALVVLILLVVYRAPGLVIVPLVAIFASLELSTGLIALLARLGQRRSIGSTSRSSAPRRFSSSWCSTARRPTIACSSSRAIARSCSAGCRRRGRIRAALSKRRPCRGGQRHDDHPRPGHDDLRRLRQVPLRRPDHRPVAGRGPAGLPDAGPGLAPRQRTDRLLAASASAPSDARDERHATSVLGRLWQAIGRAVVTRPGLIFVGCLAAAGLAGLRGLLDADHLRSAGGAEPAAAQRARDRTLLRAIFPAARPARSRCWPSGARRSSESDGKASDEISLLDPATPRA